MQKLIIGEGAISSVLTFLFLGLSFLIVNLQINFLGIEYYGILVLLLSIFGTISLFHVGIGSTLVSYYSTKDKSAFWNLYISISIIFFLASFLILILCAPFFSQIFNLLSLDERKLNLYTYFGAGMIGISRLLVTVISSYWVAKINYFKLKLFNFASFNLPLIITALLFFLKIDFSMALFYSGIINVIIVIITFALIIISNEKTSYEFNLKSIKQVFGKSVEFQGIAVMSTLARPALNTLINNKLGIASVSYFDIILKLLLSLRQIIVAATEPFFSVITNLVNQKKEKHIYLLIQKYTFYVAILSVAYVIALYITAPLIMGLWLGEAFTDNTTIKIINIISIGLGFNIATSVIYNSFLSFRYGRINNFIHQTILTMFIVAMFVGNITDSISLAIIYSASYIFGAIYLYCAFKYKYKNDGK